MMILYFSFVSLFLDPEKVTFLTLVLHGGAPRPC